MTNEQDEQGGRGPTTTATTTVAISFSAPQVEARLVDSSKVGPFPLIKIGDDVNLFPRDLAALDSLIMQLTQLREELT